MRLHGNVFPVGRIGPFAVDDRRLAGVLRDALNGDPALAVKVGDQLVAGRITHAEVVEGPTGCAVSVTLELDDDHVAAAGGQPTAITDAAATSAAADEALRDS